MRRRRIDTLNVKAPDKQKTWRSGKAKRRMVVRESHVPARSATTTMVTMIPILETALGRLYEADCLSVMKSLRNETVDLAFADPPFNLGKKYGAGINDSRAANDYLSWCKSWLDEMTRLLKPGGSLFLWNLPRWNLPLGAHLAQSLTFRNWIAVDIKYSLPIPKRLYPSHYSLLYFIKGSRPNCFHPDRLPTPCCRHCGGEQRDYGGYKNKMNPRGVSLSDVWTDIPPVRHPRYKRRAANALSLKVMDRVLSLASDPGSLVLDPFGGSGTTYVAAELLGRRWIGAELDCTAIRNRFARIQDDAEYLRELHKNKNVLFTQAALARRRRSGTPLSKDYRMQHELPQRLEEPQLMLLP